MYSFVGEKCESIVVEGEPTPFEQSFKLINILSAEAKEDAYFEQEDIVWPNEETVMKIAGHWSVDPSELQNRKDIAAGLGLLGTRIKQHNKSLFLQLHISIQSLQQIPRLYTNSKCNKVQFLCT